MVVTDAAVQDVTAGITRINQGEEEERSPTTAELTEMTQCGFNSMEGFALGENLECEVRSPPCIHFSLFGLLSCAMRANALFCRISCALVLKTLSLTVTCKNLLVWNVADPQGRNLSFMNLLQAGNNARNVSTSLYIFCI